MQLNGGKGPGSGGGKGNSSDTSGEASERVILGSFVNNQCGTQTMHAIVAVVVVSLKTNK